MARAARKREEVEEVAEEAPAETEQEHFERMSVSELRTHIAFVEDILSKKIAAERNARIKDIQEQMATFNLTPADLERRTPVKTDRGPAPARYRAPNGRTWSGRGKMAKVFEELLAQGHKIEEFLIDPQSGNLI